MASDLAPYLSTMPFNFSPQIFNASSHPIFSHFGSPRLPTFFNGYLRRSGSYSIVTPAFPRAQIETPLSMDFGLPSSFSRRPSLILPTSWQRQKHISHTPPTTVCVSLKEPGATRGAFTTPDSARAATLERGIDAAAIEAVFKKFRLVSFIAIYCSSLVKKSINIHTAL